MYERGVGRLLAGWLAACAMLLTASAAPETERILKRADAPHNAFTEGVIRLRVVVDKRNKRPVESLLDLFVKGKDASLCVFREGKQKGRKILTLGDRLWLIVPGARNAIPVSKTQRLMGAASFGDIAQLRFADAFDATLRPGDDTVTSGPGRVPCRVLDLVAKRAGSAYPKGILWIGRDDGLPRKLQLLLASGKEAREIRYLAYDDDSRLKTMEVHDLLAPGGDDAATLTFERYEARPLDPAMFDPEGARAVP